MVLVIAMKFDGVLTLALGWLSGAGSIQRAAVRTYDERPPRVPGDIGVELPAADDPGSGSVGGPPLAFAERQLIICRGHERVGAVEVRNGRVLGILTRDVEAQA